MALFPFTQDKLTGYIDATGKVVLAPKFFAGLVFRHGVAECSDHNERVFINERGNELFRVSQALHHEPFGPDGLAAFARWEGSRQRAAFRDRDGKETSLDLDDVSTPRGGLAVARRSRGHDTRWMGSAAYRSPWDTSTGPWGYSDHRGNIVIEERFAFARGFHEHRAAAAEAAKWGFIDPSGKWILSPQFDEVSDFADGRASVGTRDGAAKRPPKGKWRAVYELRWGTIDSEGSLAMPQEWRAPLVFTEGHAAACKKPFEHAFVDQTGKFTGKARFPSLHPLFRGVAPAEDKKSAKWGLVDPGGEWALAPKMESIEPFVDGLAHVTLRSSKTLGKTRAGYLNADGDIVFEYQR